MGENRITGDLKQLELRTEMTKPQTDALFLIQICKFVHTALKNSRNAKVNKRDPSTNIDPEILTKP